MTVATTTNTAIGTGNGATTVFPFTFGTLPTGDLVVTLIDLDGVEEIQTEITDYTVSGEGAEDGGSVTFLVAPPDQYTVLIQRILPFTQPTDYKNQGSFYPRTHERSFDRVTMQVQQLAEADGRTIKIPAHVQGVSTTLPTPVGNGLWGWNEDGNEARYYTPAEIGTTLAFSNFIPDTFTATAGQTDFVLTEDPGTIGNLDVSIDGATQVPTTDYTLDATTVTFTTPMAGGEKVLIRYGTALPTGITAASAVNYTPPSTGIAGSVESFLDSLWSTGSSAGAALIRWVQSGTGAVARSIQARLRGTIDIMDFVDEADDADILSGVDDAAPALSAAITEAIARGRGAVRLPAGRFLLNSKVTATLTGQIGLSIEGAGMGLTQLICAHASGDGLEINAAAGDGNWWLNVSPSSAIRVANLSILATANNLGTGLKINGNSLEGRPPAPITLDHVEIRAQSSINGQAFLTGLHLFDAGSTFLTKCRFLVGGTSNLTPTAVKIEATDATTDPTLFYFDKCEWTYGGKGIVASDHIEGIHLTNPVMVKVDVGVEWTAAGESGLHVVGGHFNCLTRNFDLNGVFDFALTGAVCFLSGATPLDHVRLDNNGSFAITCNVFRNGAKGVDVATISGTTRGGYIGSNQFEGMTTAAIALAGDSNGVTVGPNGYTNVTARVTGSGGTNAHVQKRSYSVSTAPTLVGGATSENVNVAIPAGVFLAKPSVIVTVAEAGTSDLIITPSFGTATATNVTCRVVKRDGTALAAGAVRLHMVAYE